MLEHPKELALKTDIKAMSLLLIKSKVRRESYNDIQLTIFLDSECYFLLLAFNLFLFLGTGRRKRCVHTCRDCYSKFLDNM